MQPSYASGSGCLAGAAGIFTASSAGSFCDRSLYHSFDKGKRANRNMLLPSPCGIWARQRDRIPGCSLPSCSLLCMFFFSFEGDSHNLYSQAHFITNVVQMSLGYCNHSVAVSADFS